MTPRGRYEGTWVRGESTGAGVLHTARGRCLDVLWENLQPSLDLGQDC